MEKVNLCKLFLVTKWLCCEFAKLLFQAQKYAYNSAFFRNGSVRSSSIGRNTSYHCKNLKVTKIRFLLNEISLLWSNRGRNLIILFSFIQITEDMLARILQAVERSKANWNWLWNIDVELYRWWFVTLEICRFHLDLETSLIGMHSLSYIQC